jgi:hypothetical protein
MPISRDLSHLPRTPPGVTPDPTPRFGPLLAERWRRLAEEEAEKHVSSGARCRASDAGTCARAIALGAAGFPRAPMDLSGYWNTTLGKIIHAEFEQALLERYGDDAVVEVQVRFEPGDLIEGVTASGDTSDGVVRIDFQVDWTGDETFDRPRRTVGEVKTIGGFGYKGAIGVGSKRDAEGPKTEHLLQAGVGGRARGADEVVVVYLAKECLSVNVARGLPEALRFTAEWTYEMAEIDDLVDEELRRIEGILDLLDRDLIADRKIPGYGRVLDPTTGRLEGGGQAWHCGYCAQRENCIAAGPGRVDRTAATLGDEDARAEAEERTWD